VADRREGSTRDAEAVRRAATPEFWASFDADPLARLEFLENRVAPLTGDADLVLLPYVGTDPDAFMRASRRMMIVDGQSIPEGQRGFLFSKQVYEEQIKLKAARGFDRLRLQVDELGRTIAGDAELQRLVRSNAASVRELLLQLGPEQTRALQRELQRCLHSRESDVGRLLSAFLTVDDANLHERYRLFYERLAPHLELYRIRVGDSVTINAASHGGYTRSIHLKVYGTFAFKGLERSPQAGTLSLMDLVSFRDLYGYMTQERADELAALRAKNHVTQVARDAVESDLFGAKRPVATVRAEAPPPIAASTPARAVTASGYDPEQLRRGLFVNAAVRVHDPQRIPETIRAIEAAGKRAGLPLKAVSWQAASGLFGQFVTLTRWVLRVVMLIVAAVALILLNNALVMATLERVGEIGTLRAIGAQRRVIVAILAGELIAIGSAAGGLGALAGSGVVALLGRHGIPATNEALVYFFSGLRLYPEVHGSHVAAALAAVLLVSVVSGTYPAWIAMKVSPREAMTAED
jgi:hypothetical protein